MLPAPSQDVEAQEARLARRAEELGAVERRIAAAQQRLHGEAERLKKAVAAVEEEGAALRVSRLWGCRVGFESSWAWLFAAEAVLPDAPLLPPATTNCLYPSNP